MARKLILEEKHLRRMRSENQQAWKSRKLICRAYLNAKKMYPKCRYQLYQVKQDRKTGQIPDFTLTCDGGGKWAIEIGRTGEERIRKLEQAGYRVLKVNRGQGFNFDKRVLPCKRCPLRQSRRARRTRSKSLALQ